MKPPPFKYEKPGTLDELLAGLTEHGDSSKILAGGQSLVPLMNFRLSHPEIIFDINGIAGMDDIRVENGELVLGGMARHNAIATSSVVRESCPLITQAYEHVANVTVRNRGTIGGNLSHCDPASEMPAIMQCLGARMILRRKDGERIVAAEDFFEGSFETELGPDEVLYEIRVPVSVGGYGFHEVSPRKADFAIAAVAATIVLDGGTCTEARIAHAGVTAVQRRSKAAENSLIGSGIDQDAIAKAADLAAEDLDPEILNYHGDADYKIDLVRSLCARAVADAAARA